MPVDIATIIPVAGLSSRMGAFKPLLLIAGRPVIWHTIVAAIRGGSSCVCVVLGKNAEQVQAALPNQAEIIFVKNNEFATSDMLASVKLGLNTVLQYMTKDTLIFLLPGDMPNVNPDTFHALRQRASTSSADLVIPCHDGKRGHPLLLRYNAWTAVANFSGSGGVKAAVQGLPFEHVEVTDSGILLDLDTPEDFANFAQPGI